MVVVKREEDEPMVDTAIGIRLVQPAGGKGSVFFFRASCITVASLNWCSAQPGMPFYKGFLDVGVHVVVL